MSIESPSLGELEVRINTQKAVASEMLGFDVSDPKNFTPENEAKFLTWIKQNGNYFKSVLEKNPDIWEKAMRGAIEPGDLHWIRDQLREDYDTGDEDHTPGPEPVDEL
jgi:hypothetical protein